MRLAYFLRVAVAFCGTAAVLTGCGGRPDSSAALLPRSSGGGAPLILPNDGLHLTHRTSRASWSAPDAKRAPLLYVTNANDGTVFAYTYPAGALELQLSGFKEPYGLCTDNAGDVWIVDDETSLITEYAHGSSTPIQTLTDSGEYPAGCSIDPTTGDLAVTNYETTGRGQGGVSIYRKATGNPKNYTDPSISRGWFCSYDARGDLFVDGDQSGSSGFQLAELLHGKGVLTNISISQTIVVPGGVQWNGKYVAVADENGPGNGTVYEFSISGSVGTEVSATTLDSSQNIHQFWIDPARNRIVAPSASLATVGYWSFPAGGNPTKTITGLNIPEAVALSVAHK